MRCRAKERVAFSSAGAHAKTALIEVLATLQRHGVAGLHDVRIVPDDHAPMTTVARLHQHGLGLPNRGYSLDGGTEMTAARTAYVAYLRPLRRSRLGCPRYSGTRSKNAT